MKTTMTPDELRAKALEWLDEWIRLGQEALRDAPPGPTATEIIEEGRNRLEPSSDPNNMTTSHD